VTFTSTDPVVGVFTTLNDTSTAPVTITVPVNSNNSFTTVVTGGVAFDALAGGTTTVTASATGFDSSLPDASKLITVSQPGISITPNSGAQGDLIGSGLQVSNNNVVLEGSEHGGVTVRLTSSDPSVLRVAPEGTTPGTEFIDLVFADGDASERFTIQGVRGATGTATLTATQVKFNDGTRDMEIVPAVFTFGNLTTSTNTLAADDDFWVQFHSTDPATGTRIRSQQVSAEGPLDVTFTSTDPAVGVFTTLTDTSTAPVTITVPVNSNNSFTTVATGGVAFDALAGGTTTITASATGFNSSLPDASKLITVSQPGITTFSGATSNRVGSGLQTRSGGNGARIVLDGTDHGGITVRVASSDPSVLRVSPDSTTAGTAFIDIDIPDGSSTALFHLQGVRGQTGASTVTGSGPGLADGTVSVEVVPAVVRYVNLAPTTTATATDDEFFVSFWSTNPITDAPEQNQFVSAEAPLLVTFTSSDPAVGTLTTLDDTSTSPVTITVPAHRSASFTTVGTGGVAFDPLANGSTTITASAPGFDSTLPEASFEVTVNP